MGIISRILDFETEVEEFYFLKLEALWILINLSMCDTEEASLVLQSEFNTIDDHGSLSDLLVHSEQEFTLKKSEILPKVERLIHLSLNKNTDMPYS